MLGNEDWSAIFAPEGKLLLQGEIIRRTNYSHTLASIASDGPDAFYKACLAISGVNAWVNSFAGPYRGRNSS